MWAEDRDKCRAVVNTVMSIGGFIRFGDFSVRSCEVLSFEGGLWAMELDTWMDG
jgi:hypothetical protein